MVGGWNAIAGTSDDGMIVAGSIYEAGKSQLLFAQIDSAGNTESGRAVGLRDG
jgi:hypothetical protein